MMIFTKMMIRIAPISTIERSMIDIYVFRTIQGEKETMNMNITNYILVMMEMRSQSTKSLAIKKYE